MLLTWAEHAGATSGPVALTLEGAPVRLDVSLDPMARPSGGSIDTEPDSSGVSLFPTATGSVRYRVFVRDLAGKPVSNARVRVLGQRTARTSDAGGVTLDSIAGGTQTLEVMAIGYQPQSRIVDIAPGREPTDTFVLASLRTLLDTIRVTAGRDPTGFERRRGTGVGQFITAADVERRKPSADHPAPANPRWFAIHIWHEWYSVHRSDDADVPLHAASYLLSMGFPTRPVTPMTAGHAAMDWSRPPGRDRRCRDLYQFGEGSARTRTLGTGLRHYRVLDTAGARTSEVDFTAAIGRRASHV